MRRLLGSRPVIAGVIVIGLAALYGAAVFSRPVTGAEPAVQRSARVVSGVVACPDSSSVGKAKTRVAAFTPAEAALGAASQGQAQVNEVKDGVVAPPKVALGTPGQAWYAESEEEQGPYAVRAGGAMAAGLEVEQTSSGGSGADRGLAALRCGQPGIDSWFVGPGPAEADKTELHLVNVDDEPAAVDVEALSQDGPLNTTEGRGISVKPHSGRVVVIGEQPEGLGEVAKGAELLALRVQSRQGRVAAAVHSRMKDERGVDWIPAAEPPAPRLLVPGIPQGGGDRRLLIAVPGDVDARVYLQVITEKGAFTPEGRDSLDAPARTVTPLDLDKVLHGRAAAVRISSDLPIVAGVVAQMSVDGAEDIGFTTAVPELTERGAVADLRGGKDSEARLLLSAPGREAAVRVTTVTAQGGASGAPQDVRIGAGRTASVTLRAPQGAEQAYGAVITPQPGSGPVHAARLQTTDKQGFTLLPVVSARTWVTAPAVSDTVTAILP